MLQHLTLFLDLDGVLADFDSRFKEHHGKFFREFEDEEAWKRLIEIPDFWLNLDPMEDAFDLWDNLKEMGLPVILLSSPGSHDEKRARFQKRLWVNKHLGEDVPLIMCKAKDKQRFSDRDRVLIDDMERNVGQWRQRGGHGIIHTSAKDTLEQLALIENDCKYLGWLKSFSTVKI